MVGGQDELVFDGDSLIVGSDGMVLARAPQFQETCLVVDLDLPQADPTVGEGRIRVDEPRGGQHDRVPQHRLDRPGTTSRRPRRVPAVRLADEAEVYTAIVTGLRDYVRKNGFRSVALGLSGGIDSAVTAAIAVDALGADAVYGISMPSSYSSDHSRDDAADLAKRTGLHYSVVPIEPMVQAFLDHISCDGLAQENLQARVRGTTLMALSNQHGYLVLATGNKSELAVGYSTLYGDAVGGLRHSRTYRRPWSGGWRAGGTRRRRGAASSRRFRRSIIKPPSASCGPASSTPTRCRRTTSSTTFSTTTWSRTAGSGICSRRVR